MIGSLVRGTGAVTSLGRAAQGLSEVFVPNATAGQALEHAAQRAALDQLSAEFALPTRSMFDRAVDGLNRLPRPMLALGTLGLFVHAMVAPEAFGRRMRGLDFVPDPLWWLLGAVVSFYFGARELHYLRGPRAQPAAAPLPEPVMSAWTPPDTPTTPSLSEAGAEGAAVVQGNAALSAWQADTVTR